MRLRLIALALLVMLALQPSFAAVCVTGCAMPMAASLPTHHVTHPSMAGHHHHSVSEPASGESSLTAALSCGKKLEVAAPATPVPHVELVRVQPATFVLISIQAAVPLPPEPSFTSSVPLQAPLRI